MPGTETVAGPVPYAQRFAKCSRDFRESRFPSHAASDEDDGNGISIGRCRGLDRFLRRLLRRMRSTLAAPPAVSASHRTTGPGIMAGNWKPSFRTISAWIPVRSSQRHVEDPQAPGCAEPILEDRAGPLPGGRRLAEGLRVDRFFLAGEGVPPRRPAVRRNDSEPLPGHFRQVARIPDRADSVRRPPRQVKAGRCLGTLLAEAERCILRHLSGFRTPIRCKIGKFAGGTLHGRTWAEARRMRVAGELPHFSQGANVIQGMDCRSGGGVGCRTCRSS